MHNQKTSARDSEESASNTSKRSVDDCRPYSIYDGEKEYERLLTKDNGLEMVTGSREAMVGIRSQEKKNESQIRELESLEKQLKV